MPNEPDELTRLRAENARLITLLESLGIDWQHDPAPATAAALTQPEPSTLSTAEKISLFRSLFRGRTDVHPMRWGSATTGKSGYSPACAKDKFAGLQICTAQPPAGRGLWMARVTSHESSVVLKTSPSTSVFRVAASIPHRNCFEATASAPTYTTNR